MRELFCTAAKLGAPKISEKLNLSYQRTNGSEENVNIIDREKREAGINCIPGNVVIYNIH
jgi:hypothetical protein